MSPHLPAFSYLTPKSDCTCDKAKFSKIDIFAKMNLHSDESKSKPFDGGRVGDDIAGIESMLKFFRCRNTGMPAEFEGKLREIRLDRVNRAIVSVNEKQRSIRFCGCLRHPAVKNTFNVCHHSAMPPTDKERRDNKRESKQQNRIENSSNAVQSRQGSNMGSPKPTRMMPSRMAGPVGWANLFL